MIRRIPAIILLCWAFGFLWFASALPQPFGASKTDAIVVLTGSGGRIGRGLELLRQGSSDQLLISGVDPQVRPVEFQAEFGVTDEAMECCITLGFAALDTHGNALETAQWMEENGYQSVRLVTTDWHMRRAAVELADQLPPDAIILRDAVRSEVSLWTLFLEYHKFIAACTLRLTR